MAVKSQGQRNIFDSGMADSEEGLVHFTKVLSDQNLPRNFKKELRGRIWEKPQHNSVKIKGEETAAKCIKILIRHSDKHTAKYHMTACIKCVRVWQKLASNVNITMFDSTLSRMDEVVGEVSLWLQPKVVVKPGNALCQRNPPDRTEPRLCWHSWFQAQTAQHRARLQECSGPRWRNHNKCRK